MNTETKKLALHRETLRVLDTDALNGVNGGNYPSDGGGGAGIGGIVGQTVRTLLNNPKINDTVYRGGGQINDTVYRGGGKVVAI